MQLFFPKGRKYLLRTSTQIVRDWNEIACLLWLQALYETMFRNYGILVGQVLVTKPDFYYEETRQQLFTTIQELMQLNIIPIINTNDAVSPPPQQEVEDTEAAATLAIKDNDR